MAFGVSHRLVNWTSSDFGVGRLNSDSPSAASWTAARHQAVRWSSALFELPGTRTVADGGRRLEAQDGEAEEALLSVHTREGGREGGKET